MIDMRFDEATIDALVQLFKRSGESLRADAASWLQSQLTYVRQNVYSAEMPVPMGLQVVPVSTGVPDWAEIVKTVSTFEVGEAAVVSDYADDLPTADVGGSEAYTKVKNIGVNYRYNISEMRASANGRTGLIDAKARSARNAVDVKLSKIALTGDAKFGLQGMLNATAIGTIAVSGSWAAASPATKLADLNTMYSGVLLQSGNAYYPNQVLMPVSLQADLANTFVPESNGRTILELFLAAHPGVTVVGLGELEAAAGSRTIIMGQRAEENASLDLPIPFFQLAPQARNLEIVIPCLARTSGVNIRRPLAFVKAVGI